MLGRYESSHVDASGQEMFPSPTICCELITVG